MSNTETRKGFTLIEILVVVALIAILATITFIAINPAKNFRDTRNAQRSSDVLQILNAVTQYTAEQGNDLDSLAAAASVAWAVPATTFPSCTPLPPATSNIGTTVDTHFNLGVVLTPDFIVGIPQDPSSGTAASTGYFICEEASGRVRIGTINTEAGGISVSR